MGAPLIGPLPGRLAPLKVRVAHALTEEVAMSGPCTALRSIQRPLADAPAPSTTLPAGLSTGLTTGLTTGFRLPIAIEAGKWFVTFSSKTMGNLPPWL